MQIENKKRWIYILGPLVSSVSSSISARRIVIVGGCLQFVGYLLSAFVSSVNLLYVILGIVVGKSFVSKKILC